MNSNIDLVIFGARGDLAERKLLPALYQLDRAGLLDDSMRIAGLARQEVTTEEFVGNTHENLNKYVPDSDWDEQCWARFSSRLTYVKVDFSKQEEYQNLKDWLNEERTQIYYMATPPSIFGSICENLRWFRLCIRILAYCFGKAYWPRPKELQGSEWHCG